MLLKLESLNVQWEWKRYFWTHYKRRIVGDGKGEGLFDFDVVFTTLSTPFLF